MTSGDLAASKTVLLLYYLTDFLTKLFAACRDVWAELGLRPGVLSVLEECEGGGGHYGQGGGGGQAGQGGGGILEGPGHGAGLGEHSAPPYERCLGCRKDRATHRMAGDLDAGGTLDTTFSAYDR